MKFKEFKSIQTPLFSFMGTALRGRLQGKTVFGCGYQYIKDYGFYIYVDAYVDNDDKTHKLRRPAWRKVDGSRISCGFRELENENEEPKTEAQWTNN